MHKPIIQGSVAWQDLIDQGYVVISREDYDKLTKWQPIETAPKDRFILATGPDGSRIDQVRWRNLESHDNHNWRDVDGDCHLNTAITHWMPLPEPPK